MAKETSNPTIVGAKNGKTPNPDTLLEALEDIKTNTYGVVKKGQIFAMPCGDCAKDLVKQGRAKKANQ